MVESRWDRARARMFAFVPPSSNYAIGGGWVGGSGNQGGGTTSGFIGSHGGDEDHYMTENMHYGHYPYGPGGGYQSIAAPPPRRRDIYYEPDYLRWRQSEIDRMDAEYAAYCDEKHQQFCTDFGEWRDNRCPGSPGASGQSTDTPQQPAPDVGKEKMP